MRHLRRQEATRWPKKAAFVVVAIVAAVGLATASLSVRSQADSSSQPSSPAQAGAAEQLQLHLARAAQVRNSLGFPSGASRTDKVVHDGVRKIDLDETDELDSQGKTVSLTQFDPNGAFVSAIRFDLPPQSTTAVNSSSASVSARAAAANLGLESVGPTRAFGDPADGGWVVQWDRVEQGFPVRGDGTLVRLWSDGRVASVSKVDHALTTRPSVVIGAGQARQQATLVLAQFAAKANRADFSIQPADLEWVSPNTIFDKSKPYFEDPTMRLAWVVIVNTSGATSGYLTQLTFFFDAGDGTLIGGDQIL